MSQFVLEGRLGVASALVGTFRKDDQSPDQTVIVALMPEDMKPKAAREMREQILLRARDHFVPWTPGDEPSLSGLFNRLGEDQLSFPVKDPRPAAALVEAALSQRKTKNVMYCTSTEAYLSVCSKLGVSRQDMAAIAELNALLPEPKRITTPHGVVGNAHKLCEMLAKGEALNIYNYPPGHILAGQRMPLDKAEAREYIHQIQNAVKFTIGALNGQKFNDKFGPAIHEAGNREKKIYLPYRTCLFEVTLANQRMFLLAKNRSDGWWSTPEHQMTKEDFYVTPLSILPNSNHVDMYPYTILFTVENGIFQRARLYARDGFDREPGHAETVEIMREHIDQHVAEIYTRLMLGMLSVFNSPAYQPRVEGPADALKKKREKTVKSDPARFPFYDYNIIDVPDISMRGEFFTSREAVRAYSGADPGGASGIHQRFHQRAGYWRPVPREGGLVETIFVGDYFAGNPALGILRHGRKKADIYETTNEPDPSQ